MFKDFQELLKSGDLQAIITSTLGQVMIWVLAIGLLFVILILGGSQEKSRSKVRRMAFSAIAIAIATVLSNIKILSLPQGGTVTLFSMAIVASIGYWYGIKQGMLSGLIYGVLQLIFGDAYVVHPLQLILDYPLAFAMLGLAGIFKNSENGLIKGLAIGAFGRFFCSFISGIVFFSEYAPDDMPVIQYSMAYNGAYVGLEVFFTVIILMIPAVDYAMKTIKKMAISS